MNFILFLLIALSILYGYIVIRVIVPLRYGLAGKLGLVCVLILFLLLPPLSIFLRVNDIENRFAEFISWSGYLTMGYITLSFTLLFMKDTGLATFGIARFVHSIFKKLGNKHEPVSEIPDPERRAFLNHQVPALIFRFRDTPMAGSIFLPILFLNLFILIYQVYICMITRGFMSAQAPATGDRLFGWECRPRLLYSRLKVFRSNCA